MFATMAAPNLIPISRTEFVLRQVGGKTSLYRHSIDKTIYLNDSAAAVWQLCDGERTVQQTVDLFADAYPEARAEVVADVNQSIDELYREGALRLESRPAKAVKA
jgi:coenzyme PQQ synthesis protein D (PqqD)